MIKGRTFKLLSNYWREIFFCFSATFFSTTIFLFSKLRFPNDDQFILYRYIDNISLGRGFVFNIGERILGSTTPLYTLLGGFLRWLIPFGSTPDLVAWINIIFFSLSVVPFYYLSRRFINKELSFFSVFVFILSLSRMIPEGMETPLFIFLLLSFLELLFRNYNKTAAIFLSLSILTRPDAGLVALLAGIYWLQKFGWRKTFALSSVVFFVSLPWLLFSYFYFGTIIPQSLATKIYSNEIVFQTGYQALKVQLSHLSRLYWGRIFDPDNIALQSIFNLLPVLILCSLFGLKKINRQNWIIFVIPIVYLVSFSISNPVMFPWYLSQTEPLWIIISLGGLGLLLEMFFQRKIIAKLLVLVLFIVGPIFFWSNIVMTDNPGTKIPLFVVGEYLKDKVAPGESVGLSNIGIVGYLTMARIEDFVGLINKTAVHFYPVDRSCLENSQLYVVPPELIKDTSPEWLILGDGESDPCFISGDWFRNYYSLEKRELGTNVYRLKSQRKVAF